MRPCAVVVDENCTFDERAAQRGLLDAICAARAGGGVAGQGRVVIKLYVGARRRVFVAETGSLTMGYARPAR